MMFRPNLWITGLPKAGTSSLFSMLESHPAVIGSSPKETFFLLDRDSPLLNQKDNYWKSGEIGWQQFFPPEVKSRGRYLLEGTTHLFFQREAIKVLTTHADSKFIIMLRDPAERIYSSFAYTRDTLVRMQTTIPFSQYVSDLLSRKPLHYIAHPASRYVLERELEYGVYHTFLERWYSLFDQQRIFIGLFENFVGNNQAFMENLYRFLGVDTHINSTSHRNPTVAYKRPVLHKIVLKASSYIPLGSEFKTRLKKSYLKRFSVPRPMTSMEDIAAKEKLREYFASANQKLRDDFSIDVSKWS